MLLNEKIISLTSFPERIETVNQTIETLLNQTIQADKVILWLAESQFPNKEKDLPPQLLELTSRGLTIEWCEDLKSYKKLIPALKKYPNSLIVTADDDLLYSKTWFEKLYNSYLKYPRDIQCHRISKFYYDKGYKVIGGGKDFYNDASFLNKLTGGSGALYPTECFNKDVLDQNLMMKLCPTNDDQWFWVQAIRHGTKVRVVENNEADLKYIPGTQEADTCLWKINDRGDNLFWKDFYSLLNYYPQIDSILKSEIRKRNNGVSPYVNDVYSIYKGYLNLNRPKTYNEKMQWLKLYDSTPIKTKLADKYLVRDWVKSKIGEKYLIPLLGVYDKFEDINFDDLPDKFVIKCNHGCAYNIIIKNKSIIDKEDIKQKIDKWMKENFALKYGAELHYYNIKPKIIIEKFIENKSSGDLYDYKFWCFNGNVEYIQFLSERNLGGLKMAFYDKKWKKQNFTYSYPLDNKNIEKPDNLDEMIRIAELLSSEFSHVRVDFYRLDDGTIYFGEMTFTSAGGYCKWSNDSINKNLGKLMKLPKQAYDIHSNEYYILPNNVHKVYVKNKNVKKSYFLGFPFLSIEEK